MKNLSKIIVPISAIVFNTFAIFASSSRLSHFKPGIGMIVRVFDWHIWPQWKIIRLNLFTMEKGLHSKQRQLPYTPRTPMGFLFFPPGPSKHFPWSPSVTFDLWFTISKMALFECCSKQFVKDTGRSTLHPIVDLNSSSRCDVLGVVVKKRSRWCWEKAKYLPTQFSLNEILTKVSCHFGSMSWSLNISKNCRKKWKLILPQDERL